MRKSFTLLALGASLALGVKGTAQVVYSEDFESTSGMALPSGWTQSVATGLTPSDSVGWNSGDNTTLGSTGFNMNAHTRFVAVNDDLHQFADNGNDLLMSPSFSTMAVASGSPLFLSFDCSYIAGTYSGITENASVEVSTDGGTTWTVVSTLAANPDYWWEPRYINLGAYAHMSSVMLGFRYHDLTGWLYGFGVDNIKVFAPPTNDLALTSISPAAFSPGAYAAGGSNVTMSGTVFNYGATPVTSYNINYVFNGGAVVTNTITGTIAPFAAASFAASTPVTMPTALGNYPIRMWVTLAGDTTAVNDTSVNDTLTSVSFMPVKQIVFEEGTGTWCGWCVRGIVYMDSLRALYGENVSLVAVHNGDPMVVTPYDTWMGTKIGGYPSVVVDRDYTGDPSTLLNYYTQHHNDFGFADITASAVVYGGTSVSVATTVRPALNLSGDYRLVLALTEDDVHGNGTGYDQHNYYSGSSTNLLSGGGVNYNTAPSTILAASMYYDHVARAIAPNVNGTAGVLPTTMVAGTNYSANLSATLPVGVALNKIHGIVMLIDNASGRVLNSKNMKLSLGVSDVNAGVEGISIFPNPASAEAFVSFNLANSSKVTVQVIDVAGRVVSTLPSAEYNSGVQQVSISTEALAAGLYTVKVISEAGAATERLTVIK